MKLLRNKGRYIIYTQFKDRATVSAWNLQVACFQKNIGIVPTIIHESGSGRIFASPIVLTKYMEILAGQALA